MVGAVPVDVEQDAAPVLDQELQRAAACGPDQAVARRRKLALGRLLAERRVAGSGFERQR
jgi:hypothetical protein